MTSLKDPAGQVPVNDRITTDSTGRVTILPAYQEFYRKAFARAGLNLDQYLKDKATFVTGLRVLNQAKMDALEALEAEHLASLDRTTRDYVEAVQKGDASGKQSAARALQRRKAFRVV
ncbi:hypothetical protein A6M27_12595 [Acidithiobacillus thiooxidans]|uniref:hypothetical protein n=2 Tax=Acidithiobacillus thiooxidans TaxID=930 RepID=UPI000465407F|nr:hypothetical protein [Acidithiobacillus thiooxidans]OCX83529.1 hypothetical protein A6O26_06900 [Acidithiobacillus thiooxidans]OCX86490.1 hypothetical protein A6M27_12595 [Acidithiobacillus thiooxidans]OFC48723.1 hypothetical protein BAE47_06790 [Acidithiobacillus thiooxidans]